MPEAKGFSEFLLEESLDKFVSAINGGTLYVLSRFGEPIAGIEIPQDWLTPHKSLLAGVALYDLEVTLLFNGVIKGYDIYNTLGGLRPKIFTFRDSLYVETGDKFVVPKGELFRIGVE